MSDNDTSISVRIRTPTSTRASIPDNTAVYQTFYRPRNFTLFTRFLLDDVADDDEIRRNPNISLDIPSSRYRETGVERECSICQVKLKTGDTVSTLECAHIYHTQCISEWVKYKQECPLCRTAIQVLER
jgi:hypothetical protein